MDTAELVSCFQRAVTSATQAEVIPACVWSEWVFKPQTGKRAGDWVSSTVLSTVHRYMHTTGLKADITVWTNSLIDIARKDAHLPETIRDLQCASGYLVVCTEVGSRPETGQTAVSLQPIGEFETCFSEKFGTPRQSQYAIDARGTIRLHPHISPDSLLGLEHFSHIWVLFLFHEAQGSLQAKVRPPRLDGLKQGVFATRTPHRPNPIGMSVLRLLAIEEREVRVTGVDVITGTPVLDIKPYHPADLVPGAGFPDYISTPLDLLEVVYRPEAETTIRELCATGKLVHYQPGNDIIPIITSILAQDPASVHSKTCRPGLEISGLSFDTLDLVYLRRPPVVEVVEAQYNPQRKGRGELRTRAWLEDVRKRLGLGDIPPNSAES